MNLKNYKLVVAVTGGGSLFISDRLTEGGASEYLLEAHVPYATASLDKFVGRVREKYCSASTARQMALECYQRGLALGEKKTIGIGATCSLVKPGGEREGREHSIYVAFVSGSVVVELSWNSKTAKFPLVTREQQEKFAAALIQNGADSMAHVLDGWSHKDEIRIDDVFLPFKGLGVNVKIPQERYREMLRSIVISPKMVRHHGLNSFENFDSRKQGSTLCVYSGSFNPWHEGHEEIYRQSVEIFGEENTFLELSIFNFDKPGIDSLELENRLLGIGARKSVLVTGATRFLEKYRTISCYRKNIVFSVGADTFDRIDLNDFKDEPFGAVKFLVFPRGGKTVRDFYTLPWLIDNRSYGLKTEVNISSTELRKNKKE